MTPPKRPTDRSTASGQVSGGLGCTRRHVLSAIATAGLGGFAGCMNLLNSSERQQGNTSPAGPSTTASDDFPETTTQADPSSGSPAADPLPIESSSPAVRTDGPVTSSGTNEPPYDDPVDRLALTDVTVQLAGERRRDSMLRLDDQLSIDIVDDRFEVRGRGHVEWECDTIGLRTVVLDGRHARVYAETREVDSCRTPDNAAGRGPWAITFTITGRFEGGRPDALTASVQGPFIENSGLFVTEPLQS